MDDDRQALRPALAGLASSLFDLESAFCPRTRHLPPLYIKLSADKPEPRTVFKTGRLFPLSFFSCIIRLLYPRRLRHRDALTWRFRSQVSGSPSSL